MSFITELVRATLHDREIFFVSRERSESLRQIVIGSGLLDVGKPGFLRDSEPKPEEDHTLGRRRGLFIGSRSDETQ